MLFPRNGHWLTAWTRRLRVEGSVPAWPRRSAAGASLGPEFSAAPAGAHLLETPLPRRRDSWRGRAHDLLFPSMTARNRKPNGFDKKSKKIYFSGSCRCSPALCAPLPDLGHSQLPPRPPGRGIETGPVAQSVQAAPPPPSSSWACCSSGRPRRRRRRRASS